MDLNRPHYYRSVFRAAWRGLAATTLPRMVWGVLVSAGVVVIGAVAGTFKAGALAGVIGGIGGLLVAGLLMFLWRLVKAPAEMHAEQASRKAELADRCAALEARCAALEGGQFLLSEDLERVALDHLPDEWSGSAHQTSIILRCLRAIPGPFSLSVLTDTAYEVGRAYLGASGIQQEGILDRQDYRLLLFHFDGPLELPDPQIEVVAEDPPTFIRRDALLTLWVGAKEPIEFREIQILSGATLPEAPPPPTPGS